MPLTPLTAQEIAELRKIAEDAQRLDANVRRITSQGGSAGIDEAGAILLKLLVLPRLLDEVEQVRAGAVVIRLEEDGKSVPFGAAVFEVVGKYQALLKRAREQLHVGLGGIPLGRNTDELVREIDALLGDTT